MSYTTKVFPNDETDYVAWNWLQEIVAGKTRRTLRSAHRWAAIAAKQYGVRCEIYTANGELVLRVDREGYRAP